MYWDRLLEEIIEVRGNVERVRVLFPRLEDVEPFDYAHCITLDHKRVIAGKLVSSLNEPPMFMGPTICTISKGRAGDLVFPVGLSRHHWGEKQLKRNVSLRRSSLLNR